MPSKIITNQNIQNEIKSIRPRKIAVAYLGRDWDEYISPEIIETIIISPTLGTNPVAVRNLVNFLTWSKVYFLDKLHAKIYIGKNKSFIGSPNLTKNGLDTLGLYEIGVTINDEASISTIESEFELIKDLAIKQYPTNEEKEAQLIELFKKTNHIQAEIISAKDTTLLSFDDYTPVTGNDFDIAWHTQEKVKKNYCILEKEDPLLSETSFYDNVEFWTNCSSTDEIKEHTWILLWHTNPKTGKLVKNNNPMHWLFVHQIISNGILDEKYPTMIIQRKDKQTPTPPFSLDSSFIDRFDEIINSKDFSIFKIFGQEEPWKMINCRNYIFPLLGKIKMLTGRCT